MVLQTRRSPAHRLTELSKCNILTSLTSIRRSDSTKCGFDWKKNRPVYCRSVYVFFILFIYYLFQSTHSVLHTVANDEMSFQRSFVRQSIESVLEEKKVGGGLLMSFSGYICSHTAPLRPFFRVGWKIKRYGARSLGLHNHESDQLFGRTSQKEKRKKERKTERQKDRKTEREYRMKGRRGS